MKPALTHLILSCLLLQASSALLAQDTALDLEISTESTHMSPASRDSRDITLAVAAPEQAAMSVTPGNLPCGV